MKSEKFVLCVLLSVLLLATTTVPVSAATVPTGFTDATVASGLNNPTAMALAPDGRMFVCQQGGALRDQKRRTAVDTVSYRHRRFVR